MTCTWEILCMPFEQLTMVQCIAHTHTHTLVRFKLNAKRLPKWMESINWIAFSLLSVRSFFLSLTASFNGLHQHHCTIWNDEQKNQSRENFNKKICGRFAIGDKCGLDCASKQLHNDCERNIQLYATKCSQHRTVDIEEQDHFRCKFEAKKLLEIWLMANSKITKIK